MSNFYVDGQITGPTFQQGFNLSSILASIGNRQDNKWVKVQITEPGVYYLNSALNFYCNLIIEGCEGTVISVKFTSDNDYNNSSNLISFNYITKTVQDTTTYIRPSIVIKNVEFRIDSTHWWHSEKNFFHYLKFVWAESVKIENVKMELEGQHNITNIDMRHCENVVVKNCLLKNYHNNTDQINAGGNLWFRGMTRNVKILNNIINKSGNDEALAFFGHFQDSNNKEIPTSELPIDGVCHKKNIFIGNNLFVYDKHYSNCNTNDCLISIIDSDSGQSQESMKLFNIENIVFENNRILINDLCRRFIKCRFEEQTILHDVIFRNNDFEIGDFSVVGSRMEVFELINKYPNIDSKYEILGNSLYNKATIRDEHNVPGLYFMLQDGGDVSVLGNVTRVYKSLSDQIYSQIIFFWNHHNNIRLTISDNDLEGLYLLGSIKGSQNTEEFAINTVNLYVKNNIIKGSPKIYCMYVDELNAVFDSNYIISSDSLIAFKNFGTSGKVVYINNYIESINPTINPIFYCSWETDALQSLYKIDNLCFANNVLEGTSHHPLNYLQQHMANCNITDSNNLYIN